MIFQHSWEKVLSGEKTQTCRIVKPGQRLEATYYDGWHHIVRDAKDRLVYGTAISFEPEKTYAVQPGRGKKGVARIRILDIRQVDVRNLSDESIKAEGFESWQFFMLTWTKMHDSKFCEEWWRDELSVTPHYLEVMRPAGRYDAWQITFEVVK